MRSSTPTPWRLLTGLQTCLWAVLVLCLGSAWGSRFVPSDLDKSELTLESSFTEGCRYHYNALGQMDSTVDSRVGAVVNAYDALGRLKTITRPTGVATTYSYSLRGLQDTVLHKKGSTELARFVYTYDRSGLRIGSSDVFGSTTTPVIWNHDSLMRLTQETKSGVAQSWAYDAVSNRTSQVAGGNTVAATFDIRDRMTSLGTTTYTWDVAGRLASRNVSGVGTTRLGWQDDDRLRRVDLPNGNVVDYTYDAQGLMATRTDASGTERYTWDGTLPYGQMIATTNASGALQAREVWGTDHLAEIRNDTILWLLTDGLGHVRAITDSVGKIIGRQDFDAWGNRTLDSGRTVRFGYRGEWSDPATGMVYLRARWMDPTTGRFVSEDPVLGNARVPSTQHRFLYAGNSPIEFWDPTGRFFGLAGFAAGMNILGSIENVYNGMVLAIGDAMRLSIQAKSSKMSVDEVIKEYLIGQAIGFAAGKILVGGAKVLTAAGRKIIQTIDDLPIFRSVGKFSSVTIAASREIDDLGRIRNFSVRVPRDAIGTGTATNSSSRAGMPNGYDAGHILGNILGGEGGVYSGNITPILTALNRGPMGQLEQRLASEVLNGAEVQITVALRYSGNSDVPAKITYEAIIDGVSEIYTWINK